MFFQINCVKKFENVTYVWITRGSEESIIFIKFQTCCYCISTTSVGQFATVPRPPKLQKMMSQDVLHCPFVHRHHRDILSTCSEFS
jgi:hypothetical protein